MKAAALRELDRLAERYPELEVIRPELGVAAETLTACIRGGGKLIFCGNGGSAADSLHAVGELMKGFVLQRDLSQELREKLIQLYPAEADYYIQNLQGTIPALSLVNELSLMTAFCNDRSADLVFAQQLLGHGRHGDVLVAISTSGNSPNVLHAARIARALGLSVLSLTGMGGGALAALSDVLLAVPCTSTYQIQEFHLPVYHALCLALEQELFGEI